MSPRSNEGRVERCSLSAQSVVFMLVSKDAVFELKSVWVHLCCFCELHLKYL